MAKLRNFFSKKEQKNLNQEFEEESKEKLVASHAAFIAIITVCTIGATVCIGRIGYMHHEDEVARSLIIAFDEPANKIPSPDNPGSTATNQTATIPGTDTTLTEMSAGPDMYSFSGLSAQVPDAAAYLKINNTEISYPVMYSQEEGYYLDHAADSSRNRNGAIYLSVLNSPDFSDPINYIFGHNMKSGLMFHHLNDFLDANYLNNHPDCYIVTESGTQHYTLFYATSLSSEGSLTHFTSSALGSEVYAAYMKEISAQTGHTLDAEDRLIVLITCTEGNRKNRTLVYGYLN